MNAKETLIAFMKDMNNWENGYRDAFMANNEVNKEPYLNELNNIFGRWCTVKERVQGRQVSMKVSFPPDYDPDNDEIIDVDVMKNKTSITVQKHTGFKNRYRYTLHYKNDEWRIDKKERFSTFEDKWLKDSL